MPRYVVYTHIRCLARPDLDLRCLVSRCEAHPRRLPAKCKSWFNARCTQIRHHKISVVYKFDNILLYIHRRLVLWLPTIYDCNICVGTHKHMGTSADYSVVYSKKGMR